MTNKKVPYMIFPASDGVVHTALAQAVGTTDIAVMSHTVICNFIIRGAFRPVSFASAISETFQPAY
jgi:hypothetical protein